MSTERTPIYVDLDGVLADFQKGVRTIYPSFVEGQTENNKKTDREMWKRIGFYQKRGGQFWFDLEPMEDAMQLWEYVKKYTPEILTACGNTGFKAGDQKLLWVPKHFGADVKINLVEKSVQKAQFATTPNAILIDDKMKSIQPWRDAGGVGILHTSAASTIEQLKALGL